MGRRRRNLSVPATQVGPASDRVIIAFGGVLWLVELERKAAKRAKGKPENPYGRVNLPRDGGNSAPADPANSTAAAAKVANTRREPPPWVSSLNSSA